MFRQDSDRLAPWGLVAAAAAGAAAVGMVLLRMRRRRRTQPPTPLEFIEDAVVATLRNDPQTGVCPIDVAAIAPGIIELTGTVPTHEVGQRAARLLHALPGVRTVINRLNIGALERHLADNRITRARGESRATEKQWFGARVGTGRRRQSPDTDPGQLDDSVQRQTRELEVSQVDLMEALPPEKPDQPFEVQT